VVTAPAALDKVKRALESRGFVPTQAAIGMEPTSTVKLQGSEAQSMLELADALEDLDDVQNVSANFDISEDEMARLAG
jgi:transcriptional/translational regulatory protein YebC/TACO1